MFASALQPAPMPPVVRDWFRQYFAFEEYLKRFPQLEIATLGPEGTSSEAAVKYFVSSFEDKKDSMYSLYATYEQAFEALLQGKSNLLVVANAYERIDKFYMAPDAQFVLSFIFTTPPYGVAKLPIHELPRKWKVRIATHHAPSSLIPWFLAGQGLEYDIALVTSTSEAALCVQRGDADLCVTNALSAERCGLIFISPTRSISMLWSVFGAKDGISIVAPS